ncbi:MAG: FkbM family methyltransferase [Gammaproteobacteria bacterium]|nr:FkbM family methyltransferase [Gammaproteobacteria bacterium]
MDIAEFEKLDPHRVVEQGGHSVVFMTPNSRALWRVETLFSKEPDTIEWIASFAPDDVLADIGANVGMYTIWAAKTRGVRVVAFEPEAQNYALLNRNIHANGLDERVRAYCVALSDAGGFDALYLSDIGVGGSCHSYGAALDFNNKPRAAPFAQGSVAVTLDDMVARGAMPVPHHIKIDVDGLEHRVMTGARQTLANEAVRSVLVEINTHLDEHWALVDLMLELGFDYSQEQVARAQRSEGTFEGVGNYVFRR